MRIRSSCGKQDIVIPYNEFAAAEIRSMAR